MLRILAVIVALSAGLKAIAFSAEGDSIEPYAIEGIVEDFRLPSTEGETISLQDFDHVEGIILIFTGNTCPCAQGYETRIGWIDRTYAPKGWPVIAVNSNKADRPFGESHDALRQQARDGKWTYPYLLDDDQELARAFGAIRTPHAFVLQRNSSGLFKLIYEGAIDNRPYDPYRVTRHYVAEVIEAALKGNRPPIRQVPPAGCAIEGITELPRDCPIESRIARQAGDR